MYMHKYKHTHIQTISHTLQRIVGAGGSLNVICTESLQWLQQSARAAHVVDVVYLDPMFPPKKKRSAMPKRRMQVHTYICR
jgi:hypothetical protein